MMLTVRASAVNCTDRVQVYIRKSLISVLFLGLPYPGNLLPGTRSGSLSGTQR